MTQDRTLLESLHIVRQPLYEQIADKLQEMIAANQLLPGTQLPGERELAQQLGINRTTIHQAIGLLYQRGLVEMKVGSGIYVTSMPKAVVTESIQRYFTFGKTSFDDLIRFRRILEPGMAALAAEQATTEDLARIADLLQQLDDVRVVATAETSSPRDIEHYFDLDIGFHEALATATHNELIIAVSRGLHNLMRDWLISQSASAKSIGVQEEGHRGHRVVYQAVAARDPQRAQVAMEAEMEVTCATLVAYAQEAARRK